MKSTNSAVVPPPLPVTTIDANSSGTRLANANPLPSTPWMQPAAGPDSGFIPSFGQVDMRSNPLPQPLNYLTNYDSTYDLRRIDSARRMATEYRGRSTGTPILNQLAVQNANLADQWAELAEKITATFVRLGEANAKLNSATRDYEDVAAKLRQYGLTPTIGLLLSHKKSQLDDWQVDGSADQFVNAELQRSREKQLSNGMLTFDGSNVVRQAADILALSGYGPTHADYANLTPQIQTLLRERSEWLRSLTQGYNDYRQRLGELDSASAAFGKLTDDYRKLINRHVTWIRSNEPLSTADFRKFRSGLNSLFDSRRTEAFIFSLTQKWSNNPSSGWTLLGTILIVFLVRMLAKSWLLGKRMRETTATTRKCIASLLTPLVAFGFPSILYIIARWLSSGYVSESTLHVASGLYAASFVALIVEVPRQLLRTNGFVERHLKLELPRRQRAAVYLFIIGSGLVLSAYMIAFAEHIDHGSWSGSLARLGFITALLLVAWTAHLSLKPSGGFLEPLIEKFGGSVLYRMRFLFYFLGVGFPVAMITLSVLGYQFTALEIIKRAGFMFVAILVAATLWAAVKILASGAWHALTGTRDESRLDEYDDFQPARVSGALAEHSLELKHQIAFLSQCALLLGAFVCIGWLWIDIFPNVRLGNPVVWSVQDTVTQTFLDASGQKVSRTQIETTPITALRLVLAAAALFVAFQLAKLLPGIFDALVLQRVNFDEAMEHLTLVLGRCLLFGVGCFIACRLVGLRWETIQWLAVGLTIGLGFAMQDIVRNLLGGLVVLFEKPARLGDLITVGNITGRVAAQKLRTTVLSDEEGREVIIPNKNFVSHDVVNWMGAGRLQSIPIEVAVTRDERPADVCRMLQQLMVEQPDLLLSPAPQATLVCVSQQSQRIELRAWVEEDRDAVKYRDSLLKVVVSYLTEKNLLAPNQPRQPSLKAPFERTSLNTVRKKRSA
ncbi:MAG: mechanosensitive ion channel [Pirellulaceae bacterium]|nr:mechanosensitive ion channel [Pirellulaceae bacterium]